MADDGASRGALPADRGALPDAGGGELRGLAEGVGRLALEDFADRFALELEGD